MQVVKKSTLPTIRLGDEVLAHIFAGDKNGVNASAFIVDCPPDTGPRRHTHPYEEIFIIVEGTVRLEADGEEYVATSEDICIVPAGVPHTFRNAGTDRAKMVNIHAQAKVVTEFVDDPSSLPGYSYNHA